LSWHIFVIRRRWLCWYETINDVWEKRNLNTSQILYVNHENNLISWKQEQVILSIFELFNVKSYNNQSTLFSCISEIKAIMNDLQERFKKSGNIFMRLFSWFKLLQMFKTLLIVDDFS